MEQHFTPIRQAKHHQGILELVQEGHLFIVGLNLSKYHPNPDVYYTASNREQAELFYNQLLNRAKSMNLEFTSICNPRT